MTDNELEKLIEQKMKADLRDLTKQEFTILKQQQPIILKLPNDLNYEKIRWQIDWNDLCFLLGLNPESFEGLKPTPTVSDWTKEGYVYISCYP